MHVLLQSNVSTDERNILLVFCSGKRTIVAGFFCSGYTRIADNFCVVLFSYNSHKVVLVFGTILL